MTLEELGACLRQTINDHSGIILPGMGMLYSKETAPQFIKNGNALTPPSRKIFFTATVEPQVSSQETNPVAQTFAKDNKLEYSQAYSELEELCSKAYTTLENQAYISIPDFGIIRYGSGLDFVFEPHPSLECNIQNWGLDIICAKKMQPGRPAVQRTEVQRNKSLEAMNKENNGKAAKHRTLKISALAFLVFFLLFVAAMFIFKDTFMPLWEKLLYTQEELQYLNSIR